MVFESMASYSCSILGSGRNIVMYSLRIDAAAVLIYIGLTSLLPVTAPPLIWRTPHMLVEDLKY
jgi:hypothetical protein